MAERAELAAGTKERGDCHIDFLAVECITRSPPLPLFSPLRSVTADHPWFEYYPSSFLLKRVVFFLYFQHGTSLSFLFLLFFLFFSIFPGASSNILYSRAYGSCLWRRIYSKRRTNVERGMRVRNIDPDFKKKLMICKFPRFELR